MGAAKKKREQIRQKMVENTLEWMLPASEFEASLAKSILELPFQEVRRLDAKTIAYMRMPGNECHANVGWYVRNDPSRQTSQVTGWMQQWPDFTLHSVLCRGDELMCITPSGIGDDTLLFRPDQRIQWVEADARYSPRIDEAEVPSNIRLFPEFTIARSKVALKQLESSKNPYDALEIPIEQFEDMIREFVPAEYWPEGLAA